MKIKDIKSSYLSSVIKIQTQNLVVDKNGFQINTWVDSGVIRAWVLNSSNRAIEILASNGINSLDSKQVVMRYSELVENNSRVFLNNKQYRIISMQDIEERGLFLILTIERVR